MIPAFPKVLRLGDRNIPDILKPGMIEVTEKVDGSSFAFGLDDLGQLVMRSRGQLISLVEGPQKLFRPVFNYVMKNWHDWADRFLLLPGMFVYGETLSKPKHNTLEYERVPLNNLAVFGLYTHGTGFLSSHQMLSNVAAYLGFDVVPLLLVTHGAALATDDFTRLLATDSFLGKEKIEGVVIRNLSQKITYFGSPEPFPPLAKYVRPDFKEMNDKSQREGEYGHAHSKIEEYLEQYHSPARWTKAVQRLTEQGAIEGRMQDMPKLLAEIKRDLFEEEKDNIMSDVWRLIKSNLEKQATRGVGSWYSERLAQEALDRALSAEELEAKLH